MASRGVVERVLCVVLFIVEGVVLSFLVFSFIVPALLWTSPVGGMYRNGNVVVVYSSLSLFGDLVEFLGLFMIFPAVLFLPAVHEGDSRAKILSILAFACFVLALLSPSVVAFKFGAFSTNLIYLFKVEGIYEKIFPLASKYCGSHTLDCLSLLREVSTSSPIVQTCSREIFHNTAFNAYMIDLSCLFRRLSTMFMGNK